MRFDHVLTAMEIVELSDGDRRKYFSWLKVQNELKELAEEEKAKRNDNE